MQVVIITLLTTRCQLSYAIGYSRPERVLSKCVTLYDVTNFVFFPHLRSFHIKTFSEKINQD